MSTSGVSTSDKAHCENCDHALSPDNQYCPQCGQQVLGPEARHFSTLIRNSFVEVTSINGRLLPTVIALLFSPGKLTRAHIDGQRKRYLSPVGIFLLTNLLFFLAPSLSDFNVSLLDQATLQPYSETIKPWIDATAEKNGTDFATLRSAYDLKVRDIAKTMVIIHVPIIALFSFLLGYDRRYLYADHVVMAVHFFAFVMIFLALAPFLAKLVIAFVTLFSPETGQEMGNGINILYILVVYIAFMISKAFQWRWYRSAAITLVFLLGLAVSHSIFRMVQFAVVFPFVAF
ncbi:MAG: DUF3667 domain-containing protein [Woeseiaceae bacterium]